MSGRALIRSSISNMDSPENGISEIFTRCNWFPIFSMIWRITGTETLIHCCMSNTCKLFGGQSVSGKRVSSLIALLRIRISTRFEQPWIRAPIPLSMAEQSRISRILSSQQLAAISSNKLFSHIVPDVD